jgi:hypothetical protein
MNFFFSPFILILPCLLVSCATPGDAMESWVGKKQSQIVDSWGPPTEVSNDGTGGRTLVYEQVVDGGNMRGSSASVRQPMFQRSRRIIYVDSRGIIYRWRIDQPE